MYKMEVRKEVLENDNNNSILWGNGENVREVV